MSIDIFELAKERYLSQQKTRQHLAEQDAAASVNEGGRIGVVVGGSDVAPNADNEKEASLLLCGSPYCGKSTLAQRFLTADMRSGQSQEINRTMALEYCFGSRMRNNAKELVHIWELGGGGQLADLLEVTLTEKSVGTSSLLLFLDATHPEQFQTVVEPILGVVRNRLDLLAVKMPQLVEMSERAKRRLQAQTQGQPHEDARVINPLPIPFAIVVARYDELQHYDTERKRSIYRLLRFLAHVNGAHLLAYSYQMENLQRRARQMMEAFAFGGGGGGAVPKCPVAVDVHEPIYVPPGGDTLEKIGAASKGLLTSSIHDTMAQWAHDLTRELPQSGKAATAEEDYPSAEEQFAEPQIDRAVEERRRALEIYTKEKADRQATEERARQRMAASEEMANTID